MAGYGCSAAAAPRLVLAAARGIAAWLAQQRGRPVLVNFWATWCSPCVAEMPDLLAGTRAFRRAGGVVLGVAMELMDTDVEAAAGLAKATAKAAALGLDFPVLVCTDGRREGASAGASDTGRLRASSAPSVQPISP